MKSLTQSITKIFNKKTASSLSLLLLISSTALTLPLLSGCIPAMIAGGGAAAAGSSQSPLPLGTQVEDMTIKTKATGVINKIPALNNNSNVEIVVFNRIVLLLGQVPNEDLRNQIANNISEIDRVRIVYNQLTIGQPTSFSQYAKDSWITTKVGSNFIGKINPMEFKIVTENGVVYLMALTNKEDGDIASQLASQVSGVKQVIEAYSYIEPSSTAEIDQKS